VILDGENAWEYYERNGRPFLRALYRRILDDRRFRPVTVKEAVSSLPNRRLDTIAPGSWINANFDIWIGADEDNRAWNFLGEARDFYEREKTSSHVRPGGRELAFEELLIAEGSDWCWWYGPEHDSANRPEFDELYRNHLSNVYRALGGQPPEELARSILRKATQVISVAPAGVIRPLIDGEISTYFEWIGAGLYRADHRLGAMHGKRFLVQELYYGADEANLFLRVDFLPGERPRLDGMEARLTLDSSNPARVSLRLSRDSVAVEEFVAGEGGSSPQPLDPKLVEACFRRVLEIRVPLNAIPNAGPKVRFQFSLWQDGLPFDALPIEDWISLDTAPPGDWMV
jgi:hypothetical protein